MLLFIAPIFRRLGGQLPLAFSNSDSAGASIRASNRPEFLNSRAILFLSCSILVMWAAAPAFAQPVVDHIAPGAATPAFHFPNVPVPCANDAAAEGKFVIIDGRPDRNSANVTALTDGYLPSQPDSPLENFFFADGTDGGRMRLDFDEPIDITEVATYSWHTGMRAPQVYKLYAPDASAPHFNSSPAHGVEPATCGWKLVCAVDTRPSSGNPGGQYGVRIGDGKNLITHAASLLFDVRATELGDPFGNTFYSKIDVLSDNELLKPVNAVPAATNFSFGPSAEYHVSISTRAAPELGSWTKSLEPIITKWYPILAMSLPSDGFSAPRSFTIVFNHGPGVAYTSGPMIVCRSQWFSRHLDDQGAVVHEMVHVVQHYNSPNNPTWLVEGIADYFRWFIYEPPSERPHPKMIGAHYTDSYRTTAAFLNYIVENVDSSLVVKMNAAMRGGYYSSTLWKTYTGKTVDDLWADYVKSVQK